MMNNRNFIIILAISLFFAAANCFGRNGYSIDNNLGAPTMPPSSAGGDSFTASSPLSYNGNLVITGNVRGGKHFRGVVPYRDASDFGVSLGSDSISSFLRRSAPVDYRTPAGSYQPYYLPSRTVATIRRGFVSGLEWKSIRATGGTGSFAKPISLQTLAKAQIRRHSRLDDIYEQTRPLAMEPGDIQRLISQDYYKQAQEKISDVIHKSIDTNLHRDLSKEAQDKTKRRIIDEFQKPPIPEKEELIPPQPYPSLSPETFYFPEEDPQLDTPDIFKQMQQQLEEQAFEPWQKETEPELPETKTRKTAADEEDRYKFSLREIDPATAKALRGVHKTFATRSADNFNRYLRIAEDLMKQSRFYRAADAYTLASLYKPNDPLSYAGKSHALFASGEYMSSAYFLAKAITMFPAYVNFRVDLLAMIGDKDKLQSRIQDIVTWQARSDSGELQFLLGYVYYQTGKITLAKEAINDAAEKLPDNFAVAALKKVIDTGARKN